jgi:hypothetical protein
MYMDGNWEIGHDGIVNNVEHLQAWWHFMHVVHLGITPKDLATV